MLVLRMSPLPLLTSKTTIRIKFQHAYHSLEVLSMVIEERDYAPKELQELANIQSSN